jgi:hypothetical protein
MEVVKFTESINISESLKYHLENNKPITENIFRPGSEAFFNVIKEARELFDLGRVNLCDVDKNYMNQLILVSLECTMVN